MSAPVRPGIVTTNNGAPMPLAALPQTELLTINIDQIPELADALGEGMSRSAAAAGPREGGGHPDRQLAPAVCCRSTTTPAPPRCTPSRVARSTPVPGSAADRTVRICLSPSRSVRTFYCPEDNTEDTVVLLWMTGAQVAFNDDESFYGINDAASIQYVTDTLSSERGLGTVPYIHGADAGVNES